DALGRNNLGFLVNLEVEFKSKDPNDLSGDGDKTQICEESRLIAYAADLTVPSAPTVPAPVVVRPAFNLIDFEPQSVTLTFQHGPSGEAATVLMCRDNSTWMVGPIGGEPTKVYPAGLPSVPASARWVPCEKTTACGIIATGAPVFGGVDGSNYNIQKTWTNSLPYGCRIQLEVVAVDAAGNVSTPTNLGFNIVDPP
ncbi:MAG: hypothetical protein V4692_02585, partial [Bdellovibrionota bacterium]